MKIADGEMQTNLNDGYHYDGYSYNDPKIIIL
jgi:hypothetical protein